MKKQLKERLLASGLTCDAVTLKIFSLVFFISIMAPNIYASNTLSISQDIKLSLDKKEVPLSNIISEIEQKTGYSLIVRLDDVDLKEKVTIKVQNETLDKTLNILFKSKDIKYDIREKSISIYKSNESRLKQGEPVRKVKGSVLDTKKEPLIGVSVKLKGKDSGTMTDLEGKFEINATPSDVLDISYLGYVTQSVKANLENYTIEMKEDDRLLDEVVVVGFGTQKKVNLTGSVATVSSDAFEGRAVQNATMMLQGLLPGLDISKGVGVMDAAPSINIRGMTTIGKGSSGSPLVLIDGMEGDMNMINPQDIENVSVLKDAAASSIYGSRAPFGVILITTKSGRDGRFAVNYNNSLRWSTPTKRPNVVDSYRFATYFNDAAINAKGTGKFTPERMQRIRDYMDGKITTKNIPDPNNPANWADGYDYANDNVDWWDVLYNKWNFSQEHTASITGGSEKLQMYASLNYLDNNGMIKLAKDSYKRYATNLKVTSQLSQMLHITYNIKFSRSDYDSPSYMGYIERLGYQTWPVLPVYDDNGYIYSAPSPASFIRDGGRKKSQKDVLSQQAKVTVTPIKGLNIVGEFNHSFYYNRNDSVIQKMYNHNVAGERIPNNTNTLVRKSSSANDYINPNLYATYNLKIDTHNMKIMGGFQSETGKNDVFAASRNGIIIPGMDVINGTSGMDGKGRTIPPNVSGLKDKWAVVGFFGRFNYDWKERYMAEFNIRYDGTSRFRSDKRWKAFPSISVGWNIAKEHFWSDLANLVSTLKIRSSYGVLGNQNTSSYYPTYLTMPIGTSDGKWLINGKKPNTADAPGIINSGMTWETVSTINVGLDADMLDNRLNMNFDWYQRDTKDMVGPALELPAIFGTKVPDANNTDLRTKGWELNIGWRDIINKKFSYHVNFNLSDNSTTITNYPNENFTLAADSYYSGQKIGEIWGYETIGIAKSQEEMDKHLAGLSKEGQNSLGSSWEAGDIMYKDLNGDGVINNGSNTLNNHGDLKVIGNNTPRYRFGLSLGGQWKSLDFSLFFQGVMQRDHWEGSWNFWGHTGYIWLSTAYEEHMDYFRADTNHYLGQNLNSYYPRPYDGSSKNRVVQTKYLQNGAYIRLKNIHLGYTLPKKWLSVAAVEKFRVFVTGENLWTGTKLKKMFDPEALGYGNGSIGYPLSKTLSFGVSITL